MAASSREISLYTTEEPCKLVSMMILDALGKLDMDLTAR